jgi:hypothetical protein
MWIFTTIGFYSAVAHRDDVSKKARKRLKKRGKDARIVVRGRVRRDLENLADLYCEMYGHRPAVIESDTSDYPVRIVIPKHRWALIIAALADDVDYPDFKSTVKAAQGHERYSVYTKVWTALHALQRRQGPYAGWRELPFADDDKPFWHGQERYEISDGEDAAAEARYERVADEILGAMDNGYEIGPRPLNDDEIRFLSGDSWERCHGR